MERGSLRFVDAQRGRTPFNRRMVDRQAAGCCQKHDAPSRACRRSGRLRVSFAKPHLRKAPLDRSYSPCMRNNRSFQDDGIKPAVKTVPLAQHQ